MGRKRILRKGRYGVVLLILVILLLACGGTKTRMKKEPALCGTAAGGLRNICGSTCMTAKIEQKDDSLCAIWYDKIRRAYVRWRTDMRKSFYCRFLEGTWEVKELAGCAVDSTGGEYESEEEYETYIRQSEEYIGRQYVLGRENINERGGGFVFDTYEDLFACVRQPWTLGVTPPLVGATLSLEEWAEDPHYSYIFIDSTGKAFIYKKGYFFVIERIDEGASDSEYYRWEEWADKKQPWYPWKHYD